MAQKLNVGVETHNMRLRQRRIHAGQRLITGGTMHDQLGHHGVVIRRDGVACPHTGVHAHPGVGALKAHALRQAIHLQGAGGGQEVFVRVFGANTCFNGVAIHAQFVLAQRQGFATGHAQLPLHQVQPGDGFRDWMLDLQPGIHLHEEEGHGSIGLLLNDELHRTGPHIVHSARCRHGRLAHLLAQRLGQARRRCFFQHLLMAPLHRTIALEQIDVVTLRIAKDLNFDMTWALHVLFDQHRIVAKAIDGFAFATGQRRRKISRLVHRSHALAATARAGFDQHGVPNGIGLALQQGRVLVGTVVAGHQRHARLLHQLLGLCLEPHRLDGRRRGADKDQPGIGAGLRKLFVLAQKPIARVDGLRARVFGGLQDALPPQVAVFGGIATNMHRLITHADVFGAGIGV